MTGLPPCVDPADSGDMKKQEPPGMGGSVVFGFCARVRASETGLPPQGVGHHHQRATEPMCVTGGSSQEHRPAVKPSEVGGHPCGSHARFTTTSSSRNPER